MLIATFTHRNTPTKREQNGTNKKAKNNKRHDASDDSWNACNGGVHYHTAVVVVV